MLNRIAAIFLCTALALPASTALAYDPASALGRHGERIDAPQPDFSPQWWERSNQSPRSGTRRPTQAQSRGECQTLTQQLHQLRRQLQQDLSVFGQCITRANTDNDCGREYDKVQRQQQDHESAIHHISRTCR